MSAEARAVSAAGAPTLSVRRAAAPSAHLTARIARGDEQAFAEFYELWFDRLYAMTRAATRRDESFCLDVVQDCMLRVVKSLPALATERAVTAWMGRLAFTTAMDHLRRDERRRRRELEVHARRRAEAELVAAPAGAAVDIAADEERAAWVRAQLAALPESERTLLLDRFAAGQTLAAVGAAHGMSGNAAHGRISRVLARLRRAAEELFRD